MTNSHDEPIGTLCTDSTPKDRRNLWKLNGALAAWAVCFLAVTYAIKHELLPTGPISWMAAALPTVLGIVAVMAFRRYLREADELHRVIQLEALALGFGTGWLAICGYPLFEPLGAPVASSSDFLLAMIVAYSLGSVLGRRRYR